MSETNTQKILRILLKPAVALEAAMQQVLYLRSIDTAVGAQLDVIGSLVGRAREGVTDDEIYRRYCRSQITANKSDGIIDEMILIGELVVDDVAATITLRNEGIATFVLSVDGVAITDAVAAVLIEFLLKAASGGVRPILEYSTSDPALVGHWTTQGTWGSALWARAIDKEI